MDHKPAGAPPERDSQRLRRVLTLREAVALGIGGTIGGGIFVLVGAAAGRAGPGALLAFVLAFGVSLLIALPYAELACRYPLAGGGYAFARALLGPHWGFLMGWGYWGAYIFISGYVTLGFGGYLHALTGLPPVPGALALIGICTIINLVGVRLSGLVQSLVIGLAMAALLGFSIAGLWHIHIEQFTPFLPFGLGGVAMAALLAFLAFGGFDMVAAAGRGDRLSRAQPAQGDLADAARGSGPLFVGHVRGSWGTPLERAGHLIRSPRHGGNPLSRLRWSAVHGSGSDADDSSNEQRGARRHVAGCFCHGP